MTSYFNTHSLSITRNILNFIIKKKNPNTRGVEIKLMSQIYHQVNQTNKNIVY